MNVTADANINKSSTFTSTWSEPAVSCESCHGPASGHLQWADNKENNEHVSKDKSEHIGKGLVRQLATEDHWQFVANEPIAQRLTSNNDTTAIEGLGCNGYCLPKSIAVSAILCAGIS